MRDQGSIQGSNRVQPGYQDVRRARRYPVKGGPDADSRRSSAHARTRCGVLTTCTLSMKCFKVGTSCWNTTTVFMIGAHHMQTICQDHNRNYKHKSRHGHPQVGIPCRFLYPWHYKCFEAAFCPFFSIPPRFSEAGALPTAHAMGRQKLKIAVCLLQRHLRASCFQLLLEIVCLFLGDVFLDGLGSAINKILRFLQA